MTEVDEFIAQVEPQRRHDDALILDALFQRVTGWQPVLHGTMIGYGSYAYTYDSGHSGTCLATGFAPRKAQQVLYIMPGYLDMADQMARLGKHKLGKACLYINKLDDVDLNVVEEIIRLGLKDLGKRWEITPS